MKSFYFIFIAILLFSISAEAQYIENRIGNNASTSKIVQVDYREFSTLIHFIYTNEKSYQMIQLKESAYIRDTKTNKQYKLLNSINMPIGDKFHILDNTSQNQTHNFSLEFEKLPDSVNLIDIIGGKDSGFNLYDVEIVKTKKVDYFDIESFIQETPLKEFGYYYKDGNPVYTYKYKGITIALLLTYDNNYGKYYQANFIIKNNSGKDIHFYPDNISVSMEEKGKKFNADVLSYNEYMKKVNRRQSWNSFAVAYSESLAASNAGYSSSATANSSSGYSNTSSSATGYVGNIYGSVYGSSSTYGSTYSTSYSKSYDGAIAYAAQQNANRNIASYQGQQYEIKKTLSEGYLKLNTIPNQTEYIGYLNIKYKKVDHIQMEVPFFDTNFTFYW